MTPLSYTDIEAFVQERYGDMKLVKELPGYSDVNFRLKDKYGRHFILKVSPYSQEEDAFLRGQVALLSRFDFERIPRVEPSKLGAYLESYITPDKQIWHVRLFEWVEGDVWGGQVCTTPQLRSLGALLGRLDRKLEGAWYPVIAGREHVWDHRFAEKIAPLIPAVTDPALRRIIHYFLSQFRAEVLTRNEALPRQLIHNDANEYNLIVEGDAITGMIDFGDLSHSWRVAEIAIALGYALQRPGVTLEMGAEAVKAYHEINPLKTAEIAVLHNLIAMRVCTSVASAAYESAKAPDKAYLNLHANTGAEFLFRWVATSPRHVENVFRKACGFPELPTSSTEAESARRDAYFSKALSLSYASPIKMERAALQYMFDEQGRSYLDCVNNIMHVGHCHPAVVEAGQRQMARLNTNTRYFYDVLHEYAEALKRKLPKPLTKVFFVNSGSAATDLALRMARTATEREKVMVVGQGYHGNTASAIQVSAYKYRGKGGPGPHDVVLEADLPDVYRGKYSSFEMYLGDVARLLAEKGPVAAFISESIVGCGGQVVLPPEYLESVYDGVRSQGGLCIADEVQTGFGRVGSHFWAFEMHKVVPDILIMGKPMGNGHPLAAVACTEEVAKAFETGMEFFSSFGGNPVSCAIGKAVLDVIESERLQENALEVGEYLLTEWKKLQGKSPWIGDVRGSGLFLGIELVSDKEKKTPNE
ncbi:MAG: aminotransferase class III-fold pyridoxal phosphate-dependent enzyme, partial [Bacteroidota bacterium]